MENLRNSLVSSSDSSWFIIQQGDATKPTSTRTKEENMLFERALAVFDEKCPNRWFRVAAMIPGKSVYDVINKHRELLEELYDCDIQDAELWTNNFFVNDMGSEYRHLTDEIGELFEPATDVVGKDGAWCDVSDEVHPRRDASTEVGQNDGTCMELNSTRDATDIKPLNGTCVDLNEEVVITSRKYKRKAGALSFSITLDQLQLHFGKKLSDASKELGVGRSTIKRACREYGIFRWPHSKNKKNPSLFMESTQSDGVENFKRQGLAADTRDDATLLPNLLLHPLPILDTNTGECNNQTVVKLIKDSTVIVKATFGEDTVMFGLDVSSKMDELNKEVATRFDIEVGSFKLKYLDGEGDWILVRHDDDLQFGISKLKELGKTIVKILVQLISM